MGVGGGRSHARSHDNFLSPPGAHHSFLLRAGRQALSGGEEGSGNRTVGTRDQMETTSLGPSLLWLLILLLPALLVTALCLWCRLPGPNLEVFPQSGSSDQSGGGLVILKRPYPNVSCPSAVSCDPELPSQSSPQHQRLLRHIPSRQDPDTRSEPSYENEEPVDADEDDDDHNEGYLVVLPDSTNSSPKTPSNSVPNLDSPGLRDSPSSLLWGEDYVNVPDSTEVSLGK
ncbi:linker for activation of T-cells family member 1 [Petaurus breviceps papuanus]|uniref:linker for activation of T-cells family member 1 n=1 Tax=Petaurus breviceps papuanus TaxID=3040969 RepID=UPI0036DA6AB7